MIAHAISRLVITGLILSLAGCMAQPQDRPLPPVPAPPETITLRLSNGGGTPVKLRQGFLHGLAAGRTDRLTEQRIAALRPGAWRVSNLYGTHEFVVGQNLGQRFGTQVTFNLQDLFSARWGNPVVVGPDCVANNPRHCFASYAALRQEWATFMSDFMLAVAARGGAGIDYYDIFSEPGSTFKGLTLDQIFDLLKIAHDTIRQHQPNAMIVAPSIERFDAAGLDAMFAFAVANQIRIDALSWHELEGSPADVPGHLAMARRLVATRFAAHPSLAPRQIHINEYGPPQNHLIPGWTVGWLAAFETGGVDVANRACWQIAGGWSDCANGLNGLLLEDNVTPQPLFHLHRAWAELPALRLPVSGTGPGIAAIAGRDSSGISVVIGRYSCGLGGKWCQGAPRPVRDQPMPPVTVKLDIDGLLAKGSAAVAVECYPNASLASALRLPSFKPIQSVPVVAGRTTVTLPQFADGDACLIRID